MAQTPPIICALSAINTAEMAGLISMELPEHYEKSLSIGASEFHLKANGCLYVNGLRRITYGLGQVAGQLHAFYCEMSLPDHYHMLLVSKRGPAADLAVVCGGHL